MGRVRQTKEEEEKEAAEKIVRERLLEWFFVSPCGQHIVTRYYEKTEEEAWRRMSIGCFVPSDRPSYIKWHKDKGFTMSLKRPVPRKKQEMITNGIHLQDGR